jgi:hypothetical protein
MPTNLPAPRGTERAKFQSLPGWHHQAQARATTIGPQLAFGAATVAGFATWAAAGALLPQDAVMPVVASVFLTAAACLGVIAWLRGWMNPNGVTYRDVAGALTLIGICAAATIDSEQMIRLMHSQREAE